MYCGGKNDDVCPTCCLHQVRLNMKRLFEGTRESESDDLCLSSEF